MWLLSRITYFALFRSNADRGVSASSLTQHHCTSLVLAYIYWRWREDGSGCLNVSVWLPTSTTFNYHWKLNRWLSDPRSVVTCTDIDHPHIYHHLESIQWPSSHLVSHFSAVTPTHSTLTSDAFTDICQHNLNIKTFDVFSYGCGGYLLELITNFYGLVGGFLSMALQVFLQSQLNPVTSTICPHPILSTWKKKFIIKPPWWSAPELNKHTVSLLWMEKSRGTSARPSYHCHRLWWYILSLLCAQNIVDIK